ncbi:MAG: hypothetical protein P8J87_08350 [Verrucomicrobiales bacterium]|nr:hypothetical protein [Verrucomicrobiales bacterium]
MSVWRFFRSVGVAGLTALSGAALAEDDGLPAAVTIKDYRAIFQASPFRRYLSLKETLALTGVAELPAGPVVTVVNRGSNETYVVGKRVNAKGWRLVDLEGSDDLLKVVATIDAAGQEIVLRFTPAQIEPPAARRTRERPGARDEGMVMVEALLRQLDLGVADEFVALEAERQEAFRKGFATYVRTYPEAGAAEQLGYAKDKLGELAAGGEAESEGAENANEKQR